MRFSNISPAFVIVILCTLTPSKAVAFSLTGNWACTSIIENASTQDATKFEYTFYAFGKFKSHIHANGMEGDNTVDLSINLKGWWRLDNGHLVSKTTSSQLMNFVIDGQDVGGSGGAIHMVRGFLEDPIKTRYLDVVTNKKFTMQFNAETKIECHRTDYNFNE